MKLTSYILKRPVTYAKATIHLILYTEEKNLRCWWKNQTHNWKIEEDSLSIKKKHCTKCGEKRIRDYSHPAV